MNYVELAEVKMIEEIQAQAVDSGLSLWWLKSAELVMLNEFVVLRALGKAANSWKGW
jgi:hypothetical protein